MAGGHGYRRWPVGLFIYLARFGASFVAPCYRHIPSSQACPAQDCDYEARCNNGSDTKICVAKDVCGLLLEHGDHFVLDNGVATCDSCQVLGCDVCSPDDPTTCLVCGQFFELLPDQTCLWQNSRPFWVVTWISIVFGLWFGIDLLRGLFRKETNVRIVMESLKARFRNKVRKTWEHGQPGFKIMATNLHSHTGEHAPVCGPGVPMFMNCNCLVCVIGIWLTAVAFWMSPTQDVMVLDACSPAAIIAERVGVESMDEKLLSEPTPAEESHLSWALMNYLGSAILSTIFAVYTREQWRAMEKHDVSAYRYCVKAEGFPPTATNKEEIVAVFRECLRMHQLNEDGMEYVSIAFGYDAEFAEKADKKLARHLRFIEEWYRRQSGEDKSDCCDEPSPRPDFDAHRKTLTSIEAKEHCKLTPRTDIMHTPATAGSSRTIIREASDEEPSDCSQDPGPFWVRLGAAVCHGIDPMWNGEAPDRPEPTESEDVEFKEELFSLPNAGTVFVVLKTEALATAFARIGQIEFNHSIMKSEHRTTRQKCVIRLSHMQDSPTDICWENFYPYLAFPMKQYRKMLLVPVCICIVLMIWFALYMPFFMVVMSTAGHEFMLKTLLENLLSIMIALGNCLNGYFVEYVLGWVGVVYTSKSQYWKMMMIIPMNLCNCIMDFFVVAIIVFRTSQVAEGQSWGDFSNELFALLFPSYVIVPYIGEPIGTVVLPYLLGRARIGRDKRVPKEEAEAAMRSPDIDIINPGYCDLIGTTSTIIVTFYVLPGYYHRKTFALIIVFTGIMYMQYRLKVLSWCSFTHYAQKNLHNLACAWFVLPLGLLAACVEKQYEISIGRGTVWSEVYQSPNLIFARGTGVQAFFVHFLIHCFFTEFLLPSWHQRDTLRSDPYRKAVATVRTDGSLADYLNTNPIEVLRSHHRKEIAGNSGEKLPYLVYYTHARQWLQPNAHRTFAGEDRYINLLEADLSTLEGVGKFGQNVFQQGLTNALQEGEDLKQAGADRAEALRLHRFGEHIPSNFFGSQGDSSPEQLSDDENERAVASGRAASPTRRSATKESIMEWNSSNAEKLALHRHTALFEEAPDGLAFNHKSKSERTLKDFSKSSRSPPSPRSPQQSATAPLLQQVLRSPNSCPGSFAVAAGAVRRHGVLSTSPAPAPGYHIPLGQAARYTSRMSGVATPASTAPSYSGVAPRA